MSISNMLVNYKLLFFGFILGLSGLIYGCDAPTPSMQKAIQDADWRTVQRLMSKADTKQRDTYVNMLLRTKTDLNQLGQGGIFLLGELVRLGYPDQDYSDEQQQQCNNLEYALKELIKHDKLNPDKYRSDDSKESLIQELDAKKPENPKQFSNFVSRICDQACDEKRTHQPWHFTTKFHLHQSITSLNSGFSQHRVIWRPQCLLVDYRVWATVGALFVACTYYLLKKRNSQPEQADEELEEQKPASIENQEFKAAV